MTSNTDIEIEPEHSKKADWFSDCHNAPVKVVGGEEGTNRWECTECGKSCDAYQSKHSKYSSELDELLSVLTDDFRKWLEPQLVTYINKEKAKAELAGAIKHIKMLKGSPFGMVSEAVKILDEKIASLEAQLTKDKEKL